MSSQYQIPSTPRVISPSPTPSEQSNRDSYFTKPGSARVGSVEPISEQDDTDQHDSDPEFARARSRSRSPQFERKPPNMTEMHGGTGVASSAKAGLPSAASSNPIRRKTSVDKSKPPNGHASPPRTNSYLSPSSALPQGFGSSYWRNLSRSPSPLGLIPIHREWRAFIHKHEIPRKALHVSIGFLTLYLYHRGVQPSDIHPVILGLLIPIGTTDLVRFRWQAFNRFYIRCLGAFMRESEAHDRFNGVISYLAGLWFTMRFCPKDIAVMSVLLLSWCDTAASTFGRLWGRYTPRIRRGKSLAGTLACFAVGVGASVGFWGVVAPWTEGGLGHNGFDDFAFTGQLKLPGPAREALAWSVGQASIDGPAAVGVVSVVAGLIVSVSEAVDLWGLDDNLTIPVLCGLGLGVFLWTFGGS